MNERSTIRRSFSRAAKRYGDAARLQREVSDRLLSVLPPGDAARVIDLGCGTGFASDRLSARYPSAQLLSVDFSPAMLATHRPAAKGMAVCADAHRLPFADASADLIFSSLMLQWCDLPQALSECLRVLRPGGHLCFSTVLHGSLKEIDAAFSAVDEDRHTVGFVTASALIDVLASAGLSLASLVQESRTERFDDPRSLLQSNRDIGASRVPYRGRRPVLGRTALQTVYRLLESMRTAHGIPLSYELAWVVAGRPSLMDRVT
jgi:malonyl-CoA O-methyltransferase